MTGGGGAGGRRQATLLMCARPRAHNGLARFSKFGHGGARANRGFRANHYFLLVDDGSC